MVKYTDDLLKGSDYSTFSDSKSSFLGYNGYYFFSIPDNSSLTATVSYSYSHTRQSSLYSETDIASVYNAAKDNTHEGDVVLNYSKTFSDKHSLLARARGLYEHNRTNYSGSVDALDNSTTAFGQFGVSYSFTTAVVSASLGVGWNWLKTKLNLNKAVSDYPYIDATLRFVPNKKESVRRGVPLLGMAAIIEL